MTNQNFNWLQVQFPKQCRDGNCFDLSEQDRYAYGQNFVEVDLPGLWPKLPIQSVQPIYFWETK